MDGHRGGGREVHGRVSLEHHLPLQEQQHAPSHAMTQQWWKAGKNLQLLLRIGLQPGIGTEVQVDVEALACHSKHLKQPENKSCY